EHEPVPAAGLGPSAAAERSRRRTPGTREPERQVPVSHPCQPRAPTLEALETQDLDVERERRIDVADEIADNGHRGSSHPGEAGGAPKSRSTLRALNNAPAAIGRLAMPIGQGYLRKGGAAAMGSAASFWPTGT